MEWYEAYVNFIALSQPIAHITRIYARNHQETFTQNKEKLIYSRL